MEASAGCPIYLQISQGLFLRASENGNNFSRKNLTDRREYSFNEPAVKWGERKIWRPCCLLLFA